MADEGAKSDVVLVGPLYPYRGGIARFMEEVLLRLRRTGVTAAGVTFSRQYPSLLFPGTSQLDEERRRPPYDAERILDSLNPLSWYVTARRTAARKPRLVVFSYWMSFFAPAFGVIARLLRHHGIPSVCIVHNALPHERHPGDRLLGAFFLRTCRGLLALSESVEEDLRSLGVEAPIARIDHPVYDVFGEPIDRDAAREALGIGKTSPVLLFFGIIRPYKGLDVLLKSMPQILDRLPDLRLVVAGEPYNGEDSLRRRLRALGIEHAVVPRLCYIPDDEVSTLFCAADLVVQPYTSATQSGVAQIALHFRKPTLVTDVGGLPETVLFGRAGLVVPPGDPEALAGQVIDFFVNERAASLVDGIEEARRRHSWQRVLDALLEVGGMRPTSEGNWTKDAHSPG